MSTSRLDALRMVDPVLTTIAQGYSNSTLIGKELFPIIQVAKQKGKIPVFGKEAFAIKQTERALRGSSNRIPPPGTSMAIFETQERDLESAIDYLEDDEGSEFFRYEQKMTKDLVDIILLNHEKEIADYVQNEDNFASDLKFEVGESNYFDGEFASLSPLKIVWNAKEAIRKKIAHYPNVMIMGASVYNALANNPTITAITENSSTPYLTIDLLKNLFDIEHIYIGNAVYSDENENFADVWQDNIILAYVERVSDNPSEFNPSYGYTFRREGMPEVDSYYENGGKIKVVRCTDNFGIKVTAADAAYLIYNTNLN